MGERYVPIGSSGKQPQEDGFLSFLGKLEWIRDAELENMTPFDTGKLRTPHIAYISLQGAKLASALHLAGAGISFGLLFLTIFLPQLLFLFILTEIYLLAIKIGVPVWLIHKFVTFEKGLSTEMIKYYLVGYAFFSFFADFIVLGFSVLAYILMLAFHGSGITFYDEWVYPIASFFLNPKTLLVLFVNLLVDPLPMVYLFFFRKKRKESIPPWIPLDSVPEEK